MFRIITTEKTPVLFVLCDNAHCRKIASGAIPAGMPEQQAVFGFMGHLGQQGWQIRPYGQYCPDHHDDLKLEPESPIAVVPTMPRDLPPMRSLAEMATSRTGR